MSDERIEVFESLLQHPGWSLFIEHVKTEWGPAACWRKAREKQFNCDLVDYCNGQIGALVEWPKQERDRLHRQAHNPVYDQGGQVRGGYR